MLFLMFLSSDPLTSRRVRHVLVKSKRITVSAAGEKLPSVVIRKSKKPRCFVSLTHDQFPVHYYSIKKAWMQIGIMEDWLKWLDRRMKRAKRNILLFFDNALSHPKVKLQNDKILFLPANTTSLCQPMDQAIIQTMKLKCGKRQLQHVNALTGPQILGEIKVLQAVYLVTSAWDDTKQKQYQSVLSIK